MRQTPWLKVGVLISAALIAVLALAALAVSVRTAVAVSSDPLRDLFAGGSPDRAAAATAGPAGTGIAAKLARGERVTLLLLGYGGAGHDGAFLSDSIMVVSIDGATGQVSLVSIPRDLYVEIPADRYTGAYRGKVNSAFAIPAAAGDRDEGMRVAKQVLSGVTGLPIDRVVAIDFRAFRSLVNTIGGVDVDVERAFTASYPRNDDADIDPGWIEISFSAGPQHMDGETALRYARARYADGIEGTDFARSARQQRLMLAIRTKVVSAGSLPTLLGTLDALRDNVRTDLSLADIAALGDLAMHYDEARAARGGLSTANVLVSTELATPEGPEYVLLPRIVSYREVQGYVTLVTRFGAALTDPHSVVVEANAAREGAVALAGRSLDALGIDDSTATVPGDDPSRTLVTGPDSPLTRFLAAYFDGDLRVADGSAIVVQLGTTWIPPVETTFDAAAPPTPPPAATPTGKATPRPTATARATSTVRPTRLPTAKPTR